MKRKTKQAMADVMHNALHAMVEQAMQYGLALDVTYNHSMGHYEVSIIVADED